jgi:hypothetical protein
VVSVPCHRRLLALASSAVNSQFVPRSRSIFSFSPPGVGVFSRHEIFLIWRGTPQLITSLENVEHECESAATPGVYLWPKSRTGDSVVVRRTVHFKMSELIRTSAKLVLLVVLGLASGKSNGQPQLSSQQPIPPDTLISLRRPDCFLTCADYLVTITADGTVTFEGYANVRVKNRVQSRISRDKVQILVTAFAKAKFFSLRDKYVWQEDGCRKVWPDSSAATTSILINGKSKSVDHYLGCHRKGRTSYPEALTRLEHLIDETANTAQWID